MRGNPRCLRTAAGGLNARTTIDFLMQFAYRVKPFQVINLPAWAKNEEYTISAKPPAGYRPKLPGTRMTILPHASGGC